jgi:hypothetical protein
MANHPTAAPIAASPDQRTTPPALPTRTALCDANRHHACPGKLLSLLVPPGTRCACACHTGQAPDPAGRAA